MSSSRIGIRVIRGENVRGWYMRGMTYLYNADLAQFADNFLADGQPVSSAGTTVDNQTRAMLRARIT